MDVEISGGRNQVVPTEATRLGILRQAIARVAAASTWVAVPLTIAIGTRLAIFMVADVGARLIAPTKFTGPFDIWNRYDANWYISIAAHGYNYSTVTQSSVNFFPLFPVMIKLAASVLGAAGVSNAYVVGGILVSWLAFIAACVILYRLVLERFGAPTAYRAVLLLAVYPFGGFFGVPYSESLYLLTAVLAFWGIHRRQWWVAGAGALFAGATRPPGLIVAACVVLAYALDWWRTRHGLRWDIFSLALTPMGAGAYAIYCWLRFGNPFAYNVASGVGWHRGHLQVNGLVSGWHLLIHPSGLLTSTSYTTVLFAIYALLGLIVLLSTIPMWRLLGSPYVLFTLGSLFAPIVTFPSVVGLGRYISIIFPVGIVLAYILRRWPALLDAVVILSATSLGLFSVMFALSYPVL